MKTRILMIFLAIFAAVSCQKEEVKPDFSTPVGHMYVCEDSPLSGLYFRFLDKSTVEVDRYSFKEDNTNDLGVIEKWTYSLSGNTITFYPKIKLSLGLPPSPGYLALYRAEYFIDETATFNGNEIILTGKKSMIYGGESRITLSFKAGF